MARCGWRPADRDGGGCAPGRWKPTAPSRPCPTRMAGRSAPARTAISGRAPGQDWPAGWKTGSSRCRETGCRLGRGRLGRVRSTKPCWAITGGSGTRHRRHSATNYAPRTAPFDSSPPIPPAASMPAAGAGFGNGMWRGTGPGNMARLPDPPGGSGWKVRPGRSPWAAWTGASITDLRPGRQRFELRSAASDGAWRGTCVELAGGVPWERVPGAWRQGLVAWLDEGLADLARHARARRCAFRWTWRVGDYGCAWLAGRVRIVMLLTRGKTPA